MSCIEIRLKENVYSTHASDLQAKDAIAQSVVHGALNCGILPEDDPAYTSCDPNVVKKEFIDFMKVS